MKFRADINGLRALAVLPVLFFHSGWELFSGGFLGVDVFFVISGFLITSILLKDINTSSFSFLDFYNKRIRRILPALLAVMVIVTALSFLFMLPYDLKNYGQSLVATILSANNILLYLTSGYWSLAAEFKPLYHTWSLGVEEQYYFIIPLILVLCFKWNKNSILQVGVILISLMLSSFFLSYAHTNSEFNFLIIFTRAWELLAGSLVALILINKEIKNNLPLSAIGLLLILFSYNQPYFFSENQAIYNIFPVVGTCMLIIFSSSKNFIGRALAIKPMMIIGSISYSVYLVHQPILSFLRLSSETAPSTVQQVLFSLVSIPLAFLIWKYIENPFRNSEVISNRIFYSLVVFSCLSLMSLGLVLHKTYGLQKFYPNYSYGNNPQSYADKPFKYKATEFKDNSKSNLLIIGNSFARDFINLLSENKIAQKYELIYRPNMNEQGVDFNQLLSDSDIVIYVSSAGMADKLDSELVQKNAEYTYSVLKNGSKGKVYYVGTKNFGWNNNFVKINNGANSNSYRVYPNHTSYLANKIEKQVVGDDYIDLIGLLSDENGKVPLYTPTGKFISFDTEHFTQQGAAYVGRLLLNKGDLIKL